MEQHLLYIITNIEAQEQAMVTAVDHKQALQMVKVFRPTWTEQDIGIVELPVGTVTFRKLNYTF